ALKEQQRKTRQTDLARYLVALFATTAEAPAWLGTAVTPKGEEAAGREKTRADGTTTRIFLDIETHMPLMLTYSGPAPRGGGGQGRGGQGGQGARGQDGRGAGAGDAAANAANAPQGAAPAGAPGGDAAQGG